MTQTECPMAQVCAGRLDRLEARVGQLEADQRDGNKAIGQLREDVARLSVWVKVLIGVAGLISPAATAGILKIIGAV